MPKKLTRAERYKRNYGLIKNAYQNSTLAKRGQTWSDERIYKELGVKVTSKSTPDLKKITSSQQTYLNHPNVIVLQQNYYVLLHDHP